VAAVLLAGGVGVTNGPLWAADYYARSVVSQSLGYDDNPNFSFGQTTTGNSWTSESAVGLNVGAVTPAFQFDTSSNLVYTAYPEETNLNSVDGNIAVTLARRFGLSRYGARANFLADTTRTTDIEESGQFVDANSRRYVMSVGPFVDAQIDPLNSLQASARYTNQDRVSQNFPDYEQVNVDGVWTHILSGRTQAQAAINGFAYNSNSSGSSESQSVGFSVGGIHQVTPRLSVRLLAGPQYARQRLRLKPTAIERFDLSQRDTDSDSSSWSYQVNSGVTYLFDERTDVGAGFTRSATPSTTSGVVTETNQLNLSVNHALLRNVSVGGSASYSHRVSIASGGGNDDERDTIILSPRLVWQMERDLRMTLNYTFRWQRRDVDGQSETSNGVFVAVSYNLPTLYR
jgi:hypothetical protein